MRIRGLGYDNQPWILVNEDGDTIGEGCEVLDFRGETMVITGGRPPHKPESSGFIFTEGVDGFFYLNSILQSAGCAGYMWSVKGRRKEDLDRG